MSAIEGESGTFSIVMSHRIRPFKVDSPTPVIVHLVSSQVIDGLGLPKVKSKSNFRTNLQILDSDSGLMDISYASAWQLSRTIAYAGRSAVLSELGGLVSGLNNVKKTLHATGLGILPELPTYGFIMQSRLLFQFPDIAVSAVFEEQFHTRGSDWGNIKPTAPILVQQRLASDIILELFDREPPRLVSLKFTPPAHQQTLLVAAALLKNEPGEGGIVRDKIKIKHQKIYFTKDDKKVEKDPVKRGGWLGGRVKRYPIADLFNKPSCTMRVIKYAHKIHEVLVRNVVAKE
ncbi:hypothetical protein LX32DRAFT_655137 [Colletotrichum zoysiae]|uniref:Uncharacterized protein n=1 Tax=Colletotrichum zoysiae TaxID=1216348 RepID=A0AAD9HCM4_9PEZI|nr:hypothetical protein LX32DRAFT_655137 [Colletotrichum zoysiae]